MRPSRFLALLLASAATLLTTAPPAHAQTAGPPTTISLGRGFARVKGCDQAPLPGQGILPLSRRQPVASPRGPAADLEGGSADESRDSHPEEATTGPANGCTQLWITASPGMVQLGLKKGSCLRGMTGTLCVGGAVPGTRNVRIHVDTSGKPAPNIAIQVRVKAATNLDAIGGGHHHLKDAEAPSGWTNLQQGRTDADGNFDVVYQAGMRGGVDVVLAKATVPGVGDLEAGASIVIGLPQSGLINFLDKIETMRPAGTAMTIFPTGGQPGSRHEDNHYVQGAVYRHAHEFFRTVAGMVAAAKPEVYGTKPVLIPVNDISLKHGGRMEVRGQTTGPVCGRPLDQLQALGVTPGPGAAVVTKAASHQAHDRGIDFDVGFCAVPQGAAYINGATCVPCQGSNPCVPDWRRALPRAISPDIMEAASNYMNSKYRGLFRTTVLVEGDHYHFRIIPQGAGVLPYLKP